MITELLLSLLAGFIALITALLICR